MIIEVDEFQHENYSCENKRTMEIVQDTGMRPTVFIRFNPDSYTQNNVKYTSCWGTTTKGVPRVKPSKKEEWAQRLQTLQETIQSHINNPPSKLVSVQNLFYDE